MRRKNPSRMCSRHGGAGDWGGSRPDGLGLTWPAASPGAPILRGLETTQTTKRTTGDVTRRELEWRWVHHHLTARHP